MDPFAATPDADPAHTADAGVFAGVNPKNPPNLPAGGLPALPDINSKAYWADAEPVADIHAPEFWKDAQVLDAPPNTVFDEKNGRTVALPQTLNAQETDYLIKRDVDKVENFYAMQDVGGFGGWGLGILSSFAAMPQALGGLLVETGERSRQYDAENPDKAAAAGDAVKRMTDLPVVGGMFKWAAEMGDRFFANDDKIVAQGENLIKRSKQYMKDSGLERPEEGGLAGVTYDLGQGFGSLGTALGMSVLTRSPAGASLFFGALQKSSVYQESRTAGKSPAEAGDISDLAGMMEGALEFVGLDHLIKALRGNGMVKRFIQGAAIEFTQEASQQAGEEVITQASGVRDKDFAATVGDILYNGFLGAVLGGGTNAAVGAFVRDEAEKKGLDKKDAAALGKYAAANVNLAKQNMGEFIEKELAPIAKDDVSAQKFMTLMQDFNNDKNMVDRAALDPQTRSAFDQWVEVFNQSVVAKDGGAGDVEKAFFDMARGAGVAEDVATANAKNWGQVAQKMGRVWGITPRQWFDLHGPEAILGAQGQGSAAGQDADLEAAVAGVEKDLGIGAKEPLDVGKALGDEIVFQNEEGTPARASVTFRPGQRPIINLFSAADESSLLHESAHIWLREFQAAAAITKDPRVRRDWGILQKWLKMKGGKLTVAQEEKFARGVEKYFRDGVAPTAEMQPVFDRFREWLRRIYTSADKLKVEVSPEVKGVFDKLFGGEFTQKEAKPGAGDKAAPGSAAQGQEDGAEEEHDVEADFEAHRALAAEQEKWSVPGSFMDWSSDVFTPASSRLGRINIQLKHIVRRFVFDVGLYSHEDREIVRPFVQMAADTMSAEDYKDLDFALKNRISAKVDELAARYGMAQEYAAVREMLDRVHIEAQDAGMDLGFIENYFPRRVRRGMEGEYLATIRNQPFWGDLKLAMNEADPKGAFTMEEQAEFADQWLRRQVPENKITLARKSFAKDRPIDYIKPEWNRFYQDSMETLIQYIGAMRHGIETRKLFGKSEKEKDASIGHYVLNLVQQGAITAKQEGEVKKILKAVVEPALGMASWVSWARNATYIYTMGSPISTLTQLQDFAYSLYEHKWRSFGALGRSLAGRTALTKEDLGLEDLLADYQTQEGASKAVKKMFQLIGLTWTDATFADAYIDATYRKLQAEAKKGRGHLNDLLEEVYGDQAETVRADLLAGRMTEDVKYLLFSELSDVRPLSLAEMPVTYLNGRNTRVMYMLKTYVIKQIDVFRREAFDDIFSGDAGRMAGGVQRLTGLSMCLLVMGSATDALKDMLLGRDFDLSDLIIDNTLKLFGFSKYTIYKARKDSIEEAFWGLITPPIATLPADLMSDVVNIAQGDRDLAESKVLGHTPLVGKFWYWWEGGGKDK